jgi:hypothetical protein
MADSSGTHLWLVLMRAHRSMARHAQRSIAAHDIGFSDSTILEALLHKGPMLVNEIGRRELKRGHDADGDAAEIVTGTCGPLTPRPRWLARGDALSKRGARPGCESVSFPRRSGPTRGVRIGSAAR